MIVNLIALTISFLMIQLILFLIDYKKYMQKWKNDTLYMVLDSISTMIMMYIIIHISHRNSYLFIILSIIVISLIFAIFSIFTRFIVDTIKDNDKKGDKQ